MALLSLDQNNKAKYRVDEERVGYYIGLYIIYCLLHNPWYVAADYNTIFIKSWFQYFDRLRPRLDDLGYKEV